MTECAIKKGIEEVHWEMRDDDKHVREVNRQKEGNM
jgi:hypothetical protein